MHDDIANYYGGYNDFPPNWRPIDQHEFARKLVNHCLYDSEHRQMFDPNDRSTPALSAQLFFFGNGTGVAVSSSYESVDVLEYQHVGSFWAFGCDHEFEEVAWDRERYGARMNCDHMMACKHCGYREVINSSD